LNLIWIGRKFYRKRRVGARPAPRGLCLRHGSGLNI